MSDLPFLVKLHEVVAMLQTEDARLARGFAIGIVGGEQSLTWRVARWLELVRLQQQAAVHQPMRILLKPDARVICAAGRTTMSAHNLSNKARSKPRELGNQCRTGSASCKLDG
jgi:hypothetical protein